MLSSTGWLDGITASGVVIFGIVFGLYFIYHSKKVEAKLLYYVGVLVILAGLAFLGVFLDFLNVIITGKNLDNWYYPMLSDLEKFAVINECSSIETGGRKGWIKRMKKFRRFGKIYIIDIPEGASTNLIALKLKEAERYLKTNKYLLAVDYLNLMVPNSYMRGANNDWQVLGEISTNLKQLARKKHIPIWTCAQLTKTGAKKTALTAEDIGYSYKISQDADFGLGLIQSNEMEEEGIMHIVCMKGREGRFPMIECYPDFSRMRINDKDSNKGEDNE